MKGTKKKIFIVSIILFLGSALLISAFIAIINRNSDNSIKLDNVQSENKPLDEKQENEIPNDTVDNNVPEETENDNSDENEGNKPATEHTTDESKENNGQTSVIDQNQTTEEPQSDNTPDITEEKDSTEEENIQPIVEKITLEGSVIWEDNNDQDGKRPDKITVILFADGKEVTTKAITAADEWKWAFSDLNKHNNGQEIVYTITEEEINGYTSQTDKYNIINTHKPNKVSVSGSVIWNDSKNQDGRRPNSIKIDLSANGTKILTKEASAKNNWVWTFEDLDEFQNGEKITYTVSTQDVDKYKTEIKGYEITNKYTPETVSISGITIWDDSNNKDGKRPQNIEIKILSDGNVITKETVNEGNDWCWVVSNIPKYRDGGVEIIYSVSTDSITNYTTNIDGFCITNTIINVPPKNEPETDTEVNPEAVQDDKIEESEVKADFNQEMENLLTNNTPATITILKPEASGTLTKQNESAVIDYSNTKNGYVMIKYFEATSDRLKVQIKGPSTTYTYNLPVNEWSVFPFSDGNGEYAIRIMKNVVDNKYSNALSVKHTVILEDEYAPFLRPNQYVNYENAENTVNKAAELLDDNMSVLTKVKTIYSYIVSNIAYDYEKSYTVQSGYLPDLDKVLESKKGICFDYASLMTGMLRSQNIPCKLVIGYADESYHAWISVWSPETGWIDNAIFFNGTNWQLMDPTFAAGGVQDFKGITYTTKYIY